MIRKAKLSDLDGLFNLIAFGSKVGKVLPRSKEELTAAIEDFYLWIENDQIVGCCSLEIYTQKLAEVRSLIVLPSYQGRGIGTKLIKACLEKAKEQNVYEVLTITDRVELFDKVGFQKQLNNQWPMFLKLKPNML
jgi:amino-acid N-acetyltransferase